jgi:hypothetical protein
LEYTFSFVVLPFLILRDMQRKFIICHPTPELNLNWFLKREVLQRKQCSRKLAVRNEEMNSSVQSENCIKD